jgi:thiosulfate/3-mercaptopyruvate sulfurtransferase
VQEIFLLLALAQGCGMPVATPARRAELVVSAESLARHLTDPGLVVLHLDMMPDGYRAAHIPGARWADPHRFTATRDGLDFELPTVATLDSLVESLGITNDSRVVLYGEPGHLGRVFLALEYAGLAGRVAVLNGGLTAWRAAGKPVSAAAPAARRASFTPRPDTTLVVTTAELRAHLEDRRLVLVDGRSPREYAGTDPDERRAGHIPGAGSLDWSRTFARAGAAERDGDAPLASDRELRELFRVAGIEPGKDLVLYCTVGLRAAHLFFIARYLGYNPRLYDGSIEAWSRANLPLKTGDRP